mmetsp:Transcript_12330/g.11163  ORF Transcript_12330/g.11163 Transcript_12330/m.11163 type:complete len:516 (+) Transcript_12330:66-1613(+)
MRKVSCAVIASYISTFTQIRSSDNDDNTQKKYPVYRQSEISKHVDKDLGYWVTYRGGVYDITKFVVNHPGGQDKILLAKGKDIEPFWKVYQQHYNSKLPLQLLAEMRIGSVHPDDIIKSTTIDSNDPYSSDPESSPVLIYHSKKPINAEPPRNLLLDSWITPNDLWFIRNHHPAPVNIDKNNYNISIDIPINGNVNTKSLGLSDIKNNFEKKSIVSSIQCGGNRRVEMNKHGVTAGSPWEVGAISTAKWSGAKLSDVLKSLGITIDNARALGYNHVQFFAIEGVEISIPIKKALDPDGDVLLAYEMNDSDIPVVHGFPLRLVVPGHVGIRNLKWVNRIVLSHEEAHGTWQRGMAYKGLPPSAKSLDGIDVEIIPSLQEQPVQSVVTTPLPGAVWSAGEYQTIKGYAYSGGGRGIVRVDVSIDGGKSWKTAKLLEGSNQPIDRAWAWTFWECDFDIPADSPLIGQLVQITCKAIDSSYNVQPDSVEGVWNLRGINNNAWHRVNVIVHPEQPDDNEF